ncbi:flagellar motor protein [Immundisolibacter sp.]|uniref:flagellar motor protein n=1 Tax=Immundisolibacter sp. TaxID=1934948 RepID=UPI00263739B5|nr:flagellar motor protein [Immundisolibacter sp.]MDD3652462.1 flagellar motor protein [Immundisolibacter sp.]
MDILSFAGIVVSFIAILGGNALEGGHIGSLLQLTALLIVAGGTIGAVLVQTPLPTFLRAMKMVGWVFMPPRLDFKAAIERMVEWGNVARREGLLGLEPMSESESDPFVKKGLQLLVDGSEPDTIRGVLEVELSAAEHQETAAAKVFEGMGGYAPTIGILGAVMGLIHVMENLSDPSKLGGGIAVAFVATIYGVGMANLFFLPVANKLKGLVHHRSQFKELTIEGLAAIAAGENPRNIEMKLHGYLH